uniref:Uncharacterized protein n=1 Tax=Eutreptiella gymnastica TaxID=73025 RepID=A0A7S4CZS3_9EUGL|mmetsp:Transcript_47693/g.78513  ORF Transcript_47693/g.78513 Transcript_47693/m.78513 type:complete len:101 (-) Transcript_47693:56-358(-)
MHILGQKEWSVADPQHFTPGTTGVQRATTVQLVPMLQQCTTGSYTPQYLLASSAASCTLAVAITNAVCNTAQVPHSRAPQRGTSGATSSDQSEESNPTKK